MYIQHELLNEPDDNALLWRYLDLSKFIALLENRSLYFPCLSQLNDPYEGLPTKVEYQALTSAINSGTLEDGTKSSPDKTNDTNKNFVKMSRGLIGVSCWHVNLVESAAMWDLYASRGEGIAVVTSFCKFKESLSDANESIMGGMVDYIDYESFKPQSAINLIKSATYKRDSFKHEHEFRGIYMAPEAKPNGVNISVNTEVLVNEIYVSPVSPKWFYDLIVNILSRYGIDAKVIQSELYTEPSYAR